MYEHRSEYSMMVKDHTVHHEAIHPNFSAPELKNPEIKKIDENIEPKMNAFKCDVYSFGLVLLWISLEKGK
jgi:hypothetical protein